MVHNKLEVGDYIYDSTMDIYGVVKKINDEHNIYVEYEEYGSGLYCVNPNCKDFDHSLSLIKRNNI